MTVVMKRKSLSSWIYIYALAGIIPCLTYFTSPGLRLSDNERNAAMFGVLALTILQYIECNRIYKRSNWLGRAAVVAPGTVAFLCVPFALLSWSTVL